MGGDADRFDDLLDDGAGEHEDRGGRRAEHDDEPAHADSHEGRAHGEDDEDDDDLKPIHKGIPTWEEGIGLIVAANMESRAKNPNPGGNNPRGGRGRGGNRGRGKSGR
jgi:hypothetical protein